MGIDTAKNNKLKIIVIIALAIIFVFVNLLIIQIVALIVLVYITPVPLFSILPLVLIYDAVSSGGRPFLFSIIVVGLAILFYVLKPYIRR